VYNEIILNLLNLAAPFSQLSRMTEVRLQCKSMAKVKSQAHLVRWASAFSVGLALVGSKHQLGYSKRQ
jgi:hypothetical protein